MNEPTLRQVADILRRGSWFGSLPADLQNAILRRSVVRNAEKGQIIQLEDTPSEGLAVVLEGRVLVQRHVADDDPAIMHVGGPGFWFNDVCALIGDHAAVTTVAQTPVRLMVLPTAAFQRLLHEDPSHYAQFARLVFSRYRIVLRLMAEARRLPPDGRLRLRLADLAELRRLDMDIPGIPITLQIAQAELAGMVGLSRQKLNARLRLLQAEGLITLGQRWIRVEDPLRLRESADAAPVRATRTA
jgi:CRP-like cAMP-binding protein